jgi:hypothetical protein
VTQPKLKQEDKHETLAIKDFKGLNTKGDRTAIKEEEFSWLENIMPLGNGNAKVVPQPYEQGTTIWTSDPQHAVQTNINGTVYHVIFFVDGSAVAVNRDTFAVTTIASAGKFSSSGIATGQWENEYLLISDPNGGLFLWNGTNLVSAGSVGLVIVTAGGSGYSTASVTFSAPAEAGGITATGIAVITGGAITSIAVTEAGSGYTSPPTVTITGDGSSASAVAALQTFRTGTLTATVTTGGSAYTSAPTVTLSGGTGSGGAAIALVAAGSVVSVIFTNPGSYTVAPSIGFTGGGGSGAAATASINNTQCVAVQSFSGHVWLAAGRTIFYSSAGSPNDFARTSSGNLIVTDEALFGNITALLSANGFLYFFGESSINVISDVRVSSTGSTLFTNTNVSANIGCKYPKTITSYFRSVIFVSPYGVYALVGSTTSKLSDALDGIFPNIDFNKPVTATLSVIFNVLCLVLNFRVSPDPFLGVTRNIQAVLFDKKWFISSQQINSSTPYLAFDGEAPEGPTSYGLISTGGKYKLYRLFYSFDNTVTWYFQTALWGFGTDVWTKQAINFGVDILSVSSTSISVTVDSETNSASPIARQSRRVVDWVNNLNDVVTWTNAIGNTVDWVSNQNAYNFYRGNANMFGRYLGLTASGSTSDAVVSTIMLEYERRGRWGK